MELTFLINPGASPRRSQSHRACAACRKKKKRCLHNGSEPSEAVTEQRNKRAKHGSRDRPEISPDSSRQTRSQNSRIPRAPSVQNATPSAGNEDQTRIHSRRARIPDTVAFADGKAFANYHFVGDSNPVVGLLDRQFSRRHERKSPEDHLGAWLDEESPPSHQDDTGSATDVLPPKAELDGLIDIYFSRVHPVLPLLDEDEIRSQVSTETISIPLLQAICLVSSKDRAANELLRFKSETTILPRDIFTERLYEDIIKHMPKRKEKKRILTIQILILLSLHEWGPDRSEECTLHLVHAVHHSHTIALHHLSRAERETSLSLKYLFWCLWGLDRWNAAINGRPIMMNDCDMRQKVDDIIPLLKPPFRIWLRLTEKLGQVNEFYRPIVEESNKADIEVPDFEEIVESCGAWDTSPEVLGSLEFFYHGIIILSTHSKGLQGRSHSQMSKTLQSHSVMTLASLCRLKNTSDLLPIPMSAYTLSLAFSVTFKQYRQARLSSHRLLAKGNLEIFYKCLERMRDTWWLAANMIRLGKRAVDEMQRSTNTEHANVLTSCADQLSCEDRNLHSTINPMSNNIPSTQPIESDNRGYLNEADDPVSASNMGFELSRLSPDFESLLNNSVIAEPFDAFFSSFPDVNFPSSSVEQFLWEMDT